MKIAQIAPLAESVPPRMYGGTERIISYLTEELINLGHESPCSQVVTRPHRLIWSAVPRQLCGWMEPSRISFPIIC